ncbi:MAG TPA: serine/threonine-protein kinase [Acidimicrobiales bacterium]|nr:serine/threonine-protein kinase [Acidimicrobiales bacterium]
MAYDLIARLGRGGMGVVDLARSDDGEKVALKRLTLQGSASDIARARQRLLREAEVLRRLHHPNVVRLLDVVDEGDEIVLVMPYMSGGSLAERVAQHGPAPAEEVERQARRLLGALASAHRAGVVHRDIKPANVLFDDRGEPCLADFGVALSRDQTYGLTVAGMVVGTPGFMAPEQARGEVVSPATDVFSLGATLLFAATGEGPYGQGDPGLLMVRAASGKADRIPRHLPRSLRVMLQAMLEPRPERRPSAAALAGGPEGTAPRTQELRHVRWRRRRRSAAVAAAVAVALLAAAGWVATRDRGGRDPGGALADAPRGADCTARPYQPCGQKPAPFTDGSRCIEDHADYDRNRANGCEAAPDDADGKPLLKTIRANIVPAADVDSFPVRVEDHLQIFCDGTIEFRLEAPAGMVLSLEIDGDDGPIDTATAVAGTPAVIRLGEERCGGSDATTLRAVVRAVGSDRVAGDYELSRSGDF